MNPCEEKVGDRSWETREREKKLLAPIFPLLCGHCIILLQVCVIKGSQLEKEEETQEKKELRKNEREKRKNERKKKQTRMWSGREGKEKKWNMRSFSLCFLSNQSAASFGPLSPLIFESLSAILSFSLSSRIFSFHFLTVREREKRKKRKKKRCLNEGKF